MLFMHIYKKYAHQTAILHFYATFMQQQFHMFV